jgi:alpha-galactosidase
MPKIAMIGAGSVVFASRLLGDILSFPELQHSTISLMDIDTQRLGLIEALARRMVSQEGLPTRIEATLERRRALEGTDYVLVMIQVGGLEPVLMDIEIPLTYGVKQSVGDTLGPGGVFRALRTIPVMLDICRDMEELCPEAWMINYTNPMAMNCWAMNQATQVRNVGLCHSVQGTAGQLASYIGAPSEEVSYWVAGINHMAWFLQFRWQGKDAYPLLRQAMEQPNIYQRDAVRFDIMRHFGHFVTESSQHMSEYLPYYRKREELIQEMDIPTAEYARTRPNRERQHFQEIEQRLASRERLEVQRTQEYASYIIHSLETGHPRRINGNVENAGLIANLPQGCCVEVPCLVDGVGIHPCAIGELPPQCAALNRSNIAVQELAVQAALEGDREKAIQAVLLDPLTAAVLTPGEIRKMCREMFEAEAEYLAGFCF